jgi:hypothetical protein
MKLVLYSKPGCHLCEGLQEKLQQITTPTIDLEIRNILTRDDWLHAYQYEVPVLCQLVPATNSTEETEIALPRLSPRASVAQLTHLLQKYAS